MAADVSCAGGEIRDRSGDFLFGSIAGVARALLLLSLISAIDGGAAQAAQSDSSAAEAIYAAAPPRLLQIRTLVADAGRQTSTGSGFLVTADGLAITNYHVVAQVALEPKTYRLEYAAADGSHGEVTLLGVDLPNDLAIVRLDKHDAPFFAFDERAMAGELPKGERLYSMGNPLDLGFTIVEGTFNGLVEHSYSERIHFTGALNPGMSGGPTVTPEGRVVGINVATRRGGQLVSFLVPARFAAALLQRVREHATARDLHADSINSTNCTSDTGLFVAADLNIGAIQINHSYAKAIDLNQFQFATVVTQLSQPRLVGGGPFRKWYTPERCHEGFVSAAAAPDHPPLRVTWCARAYREFDGLYDVVLIAVTQDHGSEALVSRLSLQAVGYDDAIALGGRFLEAVQVSK